MLHAKIHPWEMSQSCNMRRYRAWLCAEVALAFGAGMLTLLWPGRERTSAVGSTRNTAQWPSLPYPVFSDCELKLFSQLNWKQRINTNNSINLEALQFLLLLFLEVGSLASHVYLKVFRFLLCSLLKYADNHDSVVVWQCNEKIVSLNTNVI